MIYYIQLDVILIYKCMEIYIYIYLYKNVQIRLLEHIVIVASLTSTFVLHLSFDGFFPKVSVPKSGLQPPGGPRRHFHKQTQLLTRLAMISHRVQKHSRHTIRFNPSLYIMHCPFSFCTSMPRHLDPLSALLQNTNLAFNHHRLVLQRMAITNGLNIATS